MNIGLFLRGLFSLLLFQSLNTFFLQICCIPTLPEHVEDIRRLRERLGRSHHHLLDVVHTASGDQGIHTEFREKKEENIYILHTNGTLPALRRFLATKTLDSVAFHT